MKTAMQDEGQGAVGSVGIFHCIILNLTTRDKTRHRHQ